MVGVEEVLHRVVVCRCGNDDKVGILICSSSVKCGTEPQRFLLKEFLDVFILYRRDAFVDLLHFLGYHIHSHHVVMLREKSRHRQSHISCSGYCNF